MIKRFQSILNFGIFKNFAWKAEIPDFREKNIVYGWNYSGKTTLSRIFSSLKNKQIHPDFSDSQFKLLLEDNTELKSSELDKCNLQIEIFNAEYVKSNLKWDEDDNVNGISFDVGENVKIREEIAANNRKLNTINGTSELKGRKDPYREVINEFNQFENSKFSAEAKHIKNEIFSSLIEFDKRHFNHVKNSVISDLQGHVIDDLAMLAKTKSVSLAAKDRGLINEIQFSLNLKEFYEITHGILIAQPAKEDIILALEENKNLFHWTKEGIPLHLGKTKCSFCSNDLSPDRITQLNNYFSNQSSKLRERILECTEKLFYERNALDSLTIPSSKNDFYEHNQSGYQAQFESFGIKKNRYFDYLDFLQSELIRKESGNIFVSLEMPNFDHQILLDLEHWIDQTNMIIRQHNNFVINFDSEQEGARKSLKEHQVAQFLIEEDYLEKEVNKLFAERCVKKYDCLAKKIVETNRTLEGRLKSITAGQQELNNFITRILARDDITIEVTEDEKFFLKRGDKIAKNLSEGEKTAISFSYFLVSLESLHRDGKLCNTIIFIDDPISSLDGNHIAQIYSLINSFFFRQNEDQNDPKKFVSCFRQLFISTHNFELFSFLKDSNRINKKNTFEYYFIKRISKDESTIQSLPKSLRNYKSEYIYLFDVIYKFSQRGCQENDANFILIPNAVRRFLEIYTLFKLPDSTDEVDARLKRLMPEPHQLKILHHFSHFTTFEKVTRHDEMLMNVPEAVKELMTLLSRDELHFESLKKASSIDPA